MGGGEQGVEPAAHALPVAAGPVQAPATGTAGERLPLDAHHRGRRCRTSALATGSSGSLQRMQRENGRDGGGEIEATQAVPEGRAGGPEGPESASRPRRVN